MEFTHWLNFHLHRFFADWSCSIRLFDQINSARGNHLAEVQMNLQDCPKFFKKTSLFKFENGNFNISAPQMTEITNCFTYIYLFCFF